MHSGNYDKRDLLGMSCAVQQKAWRGGRRVKSVTQSAYYVQVLGEIQVN